jgi:hypothetical protein
MNASGMLTPIAIFAPLETLLVEDGVGSGDAPPVSKGEEFDVGLSAGTPVAVSRPVVVACAASRETIWISLFCHNTGMASQRAVISLGTI